MVKITKTFKLIEDWELEKIISEYFHCKLSISDMEVEVFNRYILGPGVNGSRAIRFIIRIPYLHLLYRYNHISRPALNSVDSFTLSEMGLLPKEFSLECSQDEDRQFITQDMLFAFDVTSFLSYKTVVDLDLVNFGQVY